MEMIRLGDPMELENLINIRATCASDRKTRQCAVFWKVKNMMKMNEHVIIIMFDS